MSEETEVFRGSPRYVCPRCGHEDGYSFDSNDLPVIGLTVHRELAPYDGIYCIKCYAKFLYENIPQMIKKETT